MLLADYKFLMNKTEYKLHKSVYILQQVSKKCDFKIVLQKKRQCLSKVNIVFKQKIFYDIPIDLSKCSNIQAMTLLPNMEKTAELNSQYIRRYIEQYKKQYKKQNKERYIKQDSSNIIT